MFPFRPRLREVTACDIGLATPVAEIALSVAGEGRVVARSGGVDVASVAVAASALVWCPLVSPDPAKQPIDEIVVIATGGRGSVLVIGSLVSSPVMARR